MAKIELKQPVVQEITDLLNGAATAVVVDYRGLTVEQDTRLRKALREAGVTYKVYKNTMIRLATKGQSLRLSILILKDLQHLQYLRMMQQQQLEFFSISQRQLTSLN